MSLSVSIVVHSSMIDEGFPQNSKASTFFGIMSSEMKDLMPSLTRIIHEGSSRGGADGHGYKAREGRIPQAYSIVRRGIRPSATRQTCPDTSPQQKLHE